MRGIIAYGTYVPAYRLNRTEIATTMRSSAGRGTRSVIGPDEDTTTMGVAAAFRATAGLDVSSIRSLTFATTVPAYVDKTNATAIHAALRMDAAAMAFDVGGAVHSATAAHLAALASGERALVVTSDVRIGLPSSADEAQGGDAAAAIVWSDDDAQHPVLAEFVAAAARTVEILDRWRQPGDVASSTWDERFSEGPYLRAAQEALDEALKAAGAHRDDLAHVVVGGPPTRAVRAFARKFGEAAKPALELLDTVGNTGAAHADLGLARVLDRASAGDLIARVVLADGAHVILLRATSAIAERPRPTAADRVLTVSYPDYLLWRGLLPREPPRRPDPELSSAPPALRSVGWKFGLVGSRCDACGNRQLPAARVCQKCKSVDKMHDESVARELARVATFTIDRLAYSLAPPLIAAVVDFAGGGRLPVILTDVREEEVTVGMPVEMTFRRISTVRGIHNYFWKARPAVDAVEGGNHG